MWFLVGIALVVDDVHKGCKLAFRYPSAKQMRYKDKGMNASAAPAPGHFAAVDTTDAAAMGKSDSGQDYFHQMEHGLFAKLFRPKNILCNQTFELHVNEIRFVSHPMLVHRSSSSSSSSSNKSSTASLKSAPPLATTTLSSVTRPCKTISTASSDASEETTLQSDTSGDITMFNVVLALDRVYFKDLNGSLAEESDEVHDESIMETFRQVARQLASAILHEELRCDFLSHQARLLLQLSDEISHHHPGHASSSNSNAPKFDRQALIDVALERSILANNLKNTFHGLNEVGCTHIAINNWVQLSLTIHDSERFLHEGSLRPYRTLLLLDDEEKIIESLPTDCSPQLITLVQAATPLRSFQELQLETSISLTQLFRLASHLVYWGVARIIDTLTRHNVYQVAPSANLNCKSFLAHEFHRKFAPYELCEMLSTFSMSRRLGEFMQAFSSQQQEEFIHMLIWLLQHDFLIQLHRYVYLMVPPGQEKDVCGGAKISLAAAASLSPPSAALDLPNVSKTDELTEYEKAYIHRMATNAQVQKLFEKLCVYFRGKHHLEEIMWRENISRNEICVVLSVFKDITLSVLHE